MNRDRRPRGGGRTRLGAAILLVAGMLLLAGSAWRLLDFVSRLGPYPQLSSGDVMRLLVLPHVLMLSGAGMVLAGVLTLGRQLIEKTRR